jgi:rRNA maturation protein Nop10
MESNIPVAKNNAAPKPVAAQSESAKSTLPTITVKLPSKGLFYPENSPLSSGTIEIYQVTAKHEDILSNANLLKKGTVLDEFLKALIATPNVTINELLIGDKNSLFIAARKSAYGEIYTSKVKCTECGVESLVDINLDNVVEKDIDTSKLVKGDNKFAFTLPTSGKSITFGLLTHKDEADIEQELKALAKMGANATSPEITTRLKYTIKSIEGDSDRSKIKNFVDTQLTAKDSLALRRFIRESTPDLDMTFEFTCPACGHQARVSIPLGANFFWPNITD